jgi:hypothetical protein
MLPTNITHRLLNFDYWIIALSLLMPVILTASNNWVVLSSISAYAHSPQPQILPILLTIIAVMFAVKDVLSNNKFNIFLAISLIGIAAFRCEDFPATHNIFAVLFFAGTTFKLMYKPPAHLRKYTIPLGVLIIFGMLGHFVFKWYSLFWAECIAFLPATFYYISKYLVKSKLD